MKYVIAMVFWVIFGILFGTTVVGITVIFPLFTWKWKEWHNAMNDSYRAIINYIGDVLNVA